MARPRLVAVARSGARLPVPAAARRCDPPRAPAFNATEEVHFAQGITLFRPSAVTHAQVARIAEAIRRGRARVRRLAEDAADLPAIVRTARLDAARRNDLAWTLSRRPERVVEEFGRHELYWIGLDGDHDGMAHLPAGWGAPSAWQDGCLCLRFPVPDAENLAAAPAGRLASRFAELQLVLAEATVELGLPAALIGDLLPLAARELLDGVRTAVVGEAAIAASVPGGREVELWSRRGRFEALVRQVNALPRTRIEDYVAALVGPGRPLQPILPTGAPGR